ncbi:hypothetical protein B0J18DRAFT_405651 [Chaetomium sp. MPI-SDFR-AT-0129]|nr:hypothetical protein B0J18DRAFT_405651 [Chaetomium sp. MPI-SDFR-AT-0129]
MLYAPKVAWKSGISTAGVWLFRTTNAHEPGNYLYFLYVVAQLKLDWRQDYRKDPSKLLKSQLGKGFWATRGRYLGRALLAALAEEFGHNMAIPENQPPAPGSSTESNPGDEVAIPENQPPAPGNSTKSNSGDGMEEEEKAKIETVAIAHVIQARRGRDDEDEDESESEEHENEKDENKVEEYYYLGESADEDK